MENSYITSLIQYLKSECDLAWEQAQNGGSKETKDEARVAYNYMNDLLTQLEHELEQNGFFVAEEDNDDNY